MFSCNNKHVIKHEKHAFREGHKRSRLYLCDADEETASQDGQRWQDDSALFTSAVYVPRGADSGFPVRTDRTGRSAGVCRRYRRCRDSCTPRSTGSVSRSAIILPTLTTVYKEPLPLQHFPTCRTCPIGYSSNILPLFPSPPLARAIKTLSESQTKRPPL